MLRFSSQSCAAAGALAVILAAACEQKTEPAPTPTTTVPGTTGPAVTEPSRPSAATPRMGIGGASASAAEREETMPVSGTDTEMPMGGGGHAGHGGHGGKAGH